MAGITLYTVFLTTVCQVTCQFYDPTILFRGFDVPFAGFLRQFSDCDDPCKSTTCHDGSSCRVVQINCFHAPCPLRPTCMADKYVDDDVRMNPCRINRPVMSTSGKELGTCFGEGSASCPHGSRCTGALYGQGSKCCYAPLGCEHARTATHRQNVEPVSLTSPPRHCPAIADHRTCEKGCLLKEDCPMGSVCCPTSCGTRSCLRPKIYINNVELGKRRGVRPRPVDNSLRRTIVIGQDKGGKAVPSGTSPGRAKLFKSRSFPPFDNLHTNPGTCRSSLHYRTCRNQCSDDSQCGVGKCCPTRCGTKICTYNRAGRYLG